jgi:protein N-terminal amidase
MATARSIRVALVQFDPQHGQVAANQATASALLEAKLGQHQPQRDTVLLIVLPEMAFSGYVFSSRAEIEPFVEHAGSGSTYQWCAATASTYNAHVVAGFPEKVVVEGRSVGERASQRVSQ